MCNLTKRVKSKTLFVVLLSVVDFANKLKGKRVRFCTLFHDFLIFFKSRSRTLNSSPFFMRV